MQQYKNIIIDSNRNSCESTEKQNMLCCSKDNWECFSWNLFLFYLKCFGHSLLVFWCSWTNSGGYGFVFIFNGNFKSGIRKCVTDESIMMMMKFIIKTSIWWFVTRNTKPYCQTRDKVSFPFTLTCFNGTALIKNARNSHRKRKIEGRKEVKRKTIQQNRKTSDENGRNDKRTYIKLA